MTPASKSTFVLGHRHLLGIEGLSAADITGLLDLSEEYVELNRQVDKKRTSLRGRTQVNLFFEASTRTQSSFELAGKRLGADVMNMSVSSSSIRKGETLMDTAVTLNAMHPDILVHGIQRHRRVHQRLALADRGRGHRHVHDVGAEAFSRQFERGLGPGRGLEEQIDLGATAQTGALLVDLAVELDIFLGKVEQAGNIGGGKPLDSQQMPVTEDEGRFRCRGH